VNKAGLSGGARGASTRDRVIDAALSAFGTRGYEATSLDYLAKELGVKKQTILYHFNSKEALLEGVVDQAAGELLAAVEGSLAGSGDTWARLDGVVKAVFRLAGRRPELLGFLREVTRLGPPAATRLAAALEPIIERASGFLEAAMAEGEIRPADPRLLLLAVYSTVVGVATEVEVLKALGVEPTARALVRRRAALEEFLRSALSPKRP